MAILKLITVLTSHHVVLVEDAHRGERGASHSENCGTKCGAASALSSDISLLYGTAASAARHLTATNLEIARTS
jgi:hypothetical protein